VDSTSACGEQIKDDIDDHVLLAADESPLPTSAKMSRVSMPYWVAASSA